jgi:hypothetical protein
MAHDRPRPAARELRQDIRKNPHPNGIIPSLEPRSLAIGANSLGNIPVVSGIDVALPARSR